MHTITKKSKRKIQGRKRHLGVENLESRLNLSAAAGLASTVMELQAARLSSTSQQGTMNKVKPLSVNLSALSSTSSTAQAAVDTTSMFGDTSLSSSSSTTVPVSDYSSINNARVEWRTSTPNIGYMTTSNVSITYKLNAATAGNYKIDLGVASQNWGAFNLWVNGNTNAAQYTFNSTGSWDNYAKTSQTVYLSAGTNTISVVPIWGSQFNINSIVATPANPTTTTTTTTTPSNTTSSSSTNNVTTLPATGADVTADKYSSIYNSKLEWVYGGADIGYVSTAGAWVEYTLNVQTAGTYKISPDMASPGWASMDLSVNGSYASNYSTNGTGAWSNFQPVSNNVYLNAGTNVLRFSSKSGTQYNLGTIRITQPSSSTTTSSTTSNTTAPISTPQAPASWSSGAVSIGSQSMTSFNQLNVTGTSGADNIYVSQSGDTISISANGQTTTYAASSYGDIVIKGGDGNDNITVDSSVRANIRIYGEGGNDTLTNKTQGNGTIVSIGGGYDVDAGNGWSTSIWGDSSDSLSGGNLHSVSGFWGGVSTDLNGQNLSDPAGTGSTTRLNNSSLWGTGPQITDVTQGLVSDCFLLAPLQTMAQFKPSSLRELAVDLGDGTYAVQFKRGGTTTYVRVDGDLPAGGYYQQGINYAHPGASGNQWMPIIEKAYAEFRTGAWNYNSLNYGNFNAVLSDFGQSVTGIGGDANSEFNAIQGALSSGKGVTYGTISGINSGAPLIGSHTYTVTAAWRDGSGTGYVTMRNPWGYDGAGWDSNTSDGYVTLSMYQLQSNMMAGSILV